MGNCESYHAQLLDYLYDLLDADVRQEFQEHLDKCAACQAALTRARAQKKLLSLAAKAQFPAVHFQVPPARTGAPAREAPVISIPAAPLRWGRWAVAACLLLVLGGLTAPALWYGYQHQQVERTQHRHDAILAEAARIDQEQQEAVARISKELQELEFRKVQLPSQWEAKWQAALDRQLKVLVSGPETLQPGAPNEYQILTRSPSNDPVPTLLSARIVDGAENVVYEEKNIACPGDYRLVLPRDLPVKPNSELCLEVAAERKDGPRGELREKLKLAAPVYVTHLSTDKPMYHPGETVRFRSLTLDRFSLTPPQDDFLVQYTVTDAKGEQVYQHAGKTQLLDPRKSDGSMLMGPDGQPIRGIGSGEFHIDANRPGGEYTLTVREVHNRFPPEKRKFIVNQYERPQLSKTLDFSRKSYGPGDEVAAACKVARAEGGSPVAHQPVAASIQIDGKTYDAAGKESTKGLSLRTDASGAVTVRFKLPTAIERGQASLSVQFSDGGSHETLVQPIPIVLKKLQVEFFPEGGDLIAELPNRVYFQARTTLDRPADLKGRIVDDQGQVAAEQVETLNDGAEPGVNQGMGRFTFTPRTGRRYQLKIDAPEGIEGQYPLPEAKADGVVLKIAEGVTTAREPLQVQVQCAERERTLLVGAYCRGRLLDHQVIVAPKGKVADANLRPVGEIGGVYRVTVFEERGEGGRRRQLVPVAERLVYRKPAEQLRLVAKADKKQHIPGDPVKLMLSATDEKDAAVPAIVTVAVVDKSILTLADEKTFRTMPTHFYLTTEVRRPEDLEYADFLLGSHPKAAAALDLLLGTQGWRRFAEQDPARFQKNQTEDSARLLVLTGRSSPPMIDLLEQEKEAIEQNYAREAANLQDQLNAAGAALVQAQNRAPVNEQLRQLQAEAAHARAEHARAAAALDWFAGQLRFWALPLLGFVLALVGVSLIAGFLRRWPGAVPYYATAAACSLLFVAMLVFVPWERTVAPQLASDFSSLIAPQASSTPEAVARVPRATTAAARSGQMSAPAAEDESAPAKGRQRWGAAVQGQPAPNADIRVIMRNDANPHPLFAKPQRPQIGQNDYYLDPKAADPRKANVGLAVKGKDVLKAVPRAEEWRRKVAEKEVAQAEDKPAGRPEEAGADRRERLLRLEDGVAGKQAQANRPGVPMLRQQLAVPAQKLAAGEFARPFDFEAKLREADALGDLQAGGVRRGFGVGRFALIEDLKEDGKNLGYRFRRGAQVAASPAFVVREYAHARSAAATEVRSDFAETLLWQPACVLPNGTAEVSFNLCDSVTTFEIAVYGHTLNGRIGAATSTVEARLPFTIEPKIPIEVTAGDIIDIPVSIANNTDSERAVSLRMDCNGLALQGKSEEQLTMQADQRTRRLFRFKPTLVEGVANLSLEGQSRPFSDRVTRGFAVVPAGFPVNGSHSDLLEKVALNEITLPESWLPGTLKCQVQVYPSTLATLQKGLEGMLREPGGCFEQTSTTSYPNLLILDYLRESDQAKPEIERRARDLLAKGYQRLTSFECLDQGANQRRGYEWFGGTAPAHEALTAYGLLQFRDMARVYAADGTMVERTRTYLMSRKDGKGGFKRNRRALDTFGRAPDNITNAYIVWSLTESGKEDDIEQELAALSKQAQTSKDPYFLALVANSLINRGRAEESAGLLKTLADAQKPDGHLDAQKTSITGSGGRDLQIETTALTTLAWLKANRPEYIKNVQRAVDWIGKQRGGHGSFGSTQSTILALKALIAFTRANKKTAEAGALHLHVGATPVARLSFPAGAQEVLALNLPEPEKHLKPGKNRVRIEITGRNAFPYTLAWSYQTLKPVSADKCPVQLRTRLDRQAASEGETVRLTIGVENASGKGQGMAVAIVGLPAGLTLPEDMKQLKEHARLRNNGTEAGLISAWETRGRELILYWRDLEPQQKIEVPLDLICRVPGEYSGPASRAYLYYNADLKCWVEPLKVKIAAKTE